MRKPHVLAFGIMVFPAAIGVVLGQEQKAPRNWRGKIAYENGVRLIVNPTDPLFPGAEFVLKEELVIGDEKDERRFFPRGAILSVDASGDIFVVEGMNRRVQKFDVNGKFVQMIGRFGQGPGEYMLPLRIHFGRNENILLRESNGIIVYDKNGVFIRKIRMPNFQDLIVLISDGSLIGRIAPNVDRGQPKYLIAQYDSEGNLLREIGSFTGEFGSKTRWIARHWYSHQTAVARIGENLFGYSFSDTYKVWVADQNARIIYAFVKEEVLPNITLREKSENQKRGISISYGYRGSENNLLYTEHRPVFSEILSDNGGHIYIFRKNSIFEQNAPVTVDVFSNEGFYLYRLKWPFIPAVISNGNIYTVKQDEEAGLTKVIRYRIENWSQLIQKELAERLLR